MFSRVLVRSALQSTYRASLNETKENIEQETNRRIFIAKNVLKSLTPQLETSASTMTNSAAPEAVRRAAAAICERCFETQLESCVTLLQKAEESTIIRRSLGIITEVSKNYPCVYELQFR